MITTGMCSQDADLAVERLRAGGLVALPTETVYGLAADARQPDAVARIFEVKGRPTDHPLIVHLADGALIDEWATDIPDAARRLADLCWPGPLTMLLSRAAHVDDVVTGGRPTIGLRVPAHDTTRQVLHELDSGVAAPSANRFGRVSPTTASHVADDIGHLLDAERDMILDGGACTVGIESTIVDLSVSPPQVVRAGAITEANLAALIGPLGATTGPSRAAGMLVSHYAPSCSVELADDRAEADIRADALRRAGVAVGVLDRTSDPVAAAQHLYDDLRAADRDGLDVIVAVLPPADGLGHAIRDRLTKAAAASDPGRSSPTR